MAAVLLLVEFLHGLQAASEGHALLAAEDAVHEKKGSIVGVCCELSVHATLASLVVALKALYVGDVFSLANYTRFQRLRGRIRSLLSLPLCLQLWVLQVLKLFDGYLPPVGECIVRDDQEDAGEMPSTAPGGKT